MSLVEIAAIVVSLLLLLSRFVEVCKPWWNWAPSVVAILLPPVVFILPQLVALAHGLKSLGDLWVHWAVVLVMVIVGWLPKPAAPPTK